jgi:hypothetical protein
VMDSGGRVARSDAYRGIVDQDEADLEHGRDPAGGGLHDP